MSDSISSKKYMPVFQDYMPAMSHKHVQIHEEELFFANYSLARNDTEVLEVFFKTPPGRTFLHTVFGFESLLAATWALYEGTTKTYNGTNALTVFNRFRPSRNTPTSGYQICHTPGGSGDGTKLDDGFCGGGAGPLSVGGRASIDAEMPLKEDTNYLLRITSNANSNVVKAEVTFYEKVYLGDVVTTTTTTSSTSTTSSTTSTTSTTSSTSSTTTAPP